MNPDLLEIQKKINKEFGEGTIVWGSEINQGPLPRIPSGSLTLDIALGGGWPCNQWNEVVGEESHGKTAIVLKTIAENQRRDPEWVTVWIAAEDFVPQYAQMLGCDTNRIIVVNTNIMELAYDVSCAYLGSRSIDCLVIDSLPALVPTTENEDAMEKFHVGLGARLTGQFFRKQGAAIKRSLIEDERPVTAFLINQWRDKIGVMYGDPRTTPGGKAKNYHCFVRVEVRRDDWIEDKEKTGLDGKKLRVGQTIKCRTFKNKTAPAQRLAIVDFYFMDSGEHQAGDFDITKEVITAAHDLDIIQQRGAYYLFGDDKWLGKQRLLDAVRESPKLYEAIASEVRSVL